MKDAVIAFKGILVVSSLSLLAVVCASCAFMALRKRAKEFFGKLADSFKRLDVLSKVVVLASLVLCTYVGGTKSIMSKTGHDDTIGLVAAEKASGGDVTNQVPQSLISSFGHGTNIVAFSFSATNLSITAEQFLQKVWYRETNKEAWKLASDATALPEGLSVGYTTEVNSNTTTVHFVYGPTNSYGHAMFYVGDDLPPVYIELEGGVSLDLLVMTSKKITVTYTIDPTALTGPGQVVFEKREKLNEEWSPVRTVSASQGTHSEEFPGFHVRKRAYWRIRLLVEVPE